MLLIRKNTYMLKEASSYLIKILQSQTSRTCHFSAKNFEEDYEFDRPFHRKQYQAPRKFEEDYEFDRPFRRKQYQAPRKSGLGALYSRNPRFNNKFQPRTYDPGWPNRISKGSAETASQSEVKETQVPIEKFFYVEHSDVANRTDEEVENFRRSMNISITGNNIPKPITKFDELCLPENLMQALINENYTEPSPIQAQGWPIALSGHDLVGVSQTGSGKTLAYMLPAVIHASNQQHLKSDSAVSQPKVLVLGPTRELVQQIHRVSQKFIESCGLAGAVAYGGASKHFQLCCLEGADICIATPGRLIDFLSSGHVSLENCSYLVLDEADRMLDMGFEPQIRDIVDHIRSDRQTLMWSATWPREIRNLANDFLSDFIHVVIGSGELVANPNIEQRIYILDEEQKEEKISSLLQSIVGGGENKVLVFAQTKRQVDYLANQLNRKRIPTLAIHGDISQSRRDKVLNTFRKNKSAVLIATDVAARGLDITDINHVVNYDFPLNIEDYIHRIGRTARGSASGTAHSFFTSENAGLVNDLISVLKQANQEINPDLYVIAEENQKPFRKFGGYKPFGVSKPFNRRMYR